MRKKSKVYSLWQMIWQYKVYEELLAYNCKSKHSIQLWYSHFVFEVLVNCERFTVTKPVNHKYVFDLQFEDLEVMTLRPPCPSTIANLVTRIKKGNGVKNNCLDYELPFISGCFVNRAVRANSASLEFASSSTN